MELYKIDKTKAQGAESSQNGLRVFENKEFGQVRTTVDENGEPLFCLSDVCKVLELDSGQVQKRLDKGVFTIHPLVTNGGVQNANFINEDGLYDVILDSRKQSARKFRKWITSEVLPSIRKTGSYTVMPQDYASALRALADEVEQKQKLALENAEMKPKADSYDKFLSIDDSLTVTAVAKKFGLSAMKLNKILLIEDILFKKGKTYFPRAKYQNKNYFKIKDVAYGEENITSQLRITPTGQEFVKTVLSGYGFNEQNELELN